MRYQYRVTRYDPSSGTLERACPRGGWTSYSDISRTFNGFSLSEDEYLHVEDAYLKLLGDFLHEAGIQALQLRGLENHHHHVLPSFVQPLALLSVSQCIEFARIALREIAWGRLVVPGRAYVHFGYDYYMYIGLPSKCHETTATARSRGLFVERFRSPYLRKRAMPAERDSL